MPIESVVMGSFTDVERSAGALEQLHAAGIDDQDITVMSSVPFAPAILGRPRVRTLLPQISLASALLGLVIGLFFAVITPYLYVIRVGGQPISPTPPTLLLLYEFTMLFLILGTFGGLLVLGRMPPTKPEYADPKLSADRIVLLVSCPLDLVKLVSETMRDEGAVEVVQPKRRQL